MNTHIECLLRWLKISSNDITSKIGEKKLRLVSVSSTPPVLPSASDNGTTGTVDDYILTPKETQALAYENGYHVIKDFYAQEVAMKGGSPITPSERNYIRLWNASDLPEYSISIEYDIETSMVLWTSKKTKTQRISSKTLEDLADEKKATKISNVKMDYESRGRLRALIDISLTVLKIGDIEKSNAIFLLKNAYFALYVAVGRIEGVDAHYISSIPMLKNTLTVKDEWREIRDEWTRLKKTYQTGGSDSTGLLLPSALVYEREKTHLTQRPQAEETAAETSTSKGTEK